MLTENIEKGDVMRILRISKMHTVLLGVIMMAIILCCSSQVQAAQSGDYTYNEIDKAQITKYTRAGGDVTIPSTIGGAPVTSSSRLSINSQAQAAQSGDITYTVTDGKAQITRYIGAGGVVTIPSTLDGSPVTSIGYYAFRECESIISINIPQGVTKIGGWAFYHCTGLTTISIPQGVTMIDEYAFNCCTGLTSINIPQGVTKIGNAAFAGCIRLTAITVAVGNSKYKSVNGVLYNKAGTLMQCPGGITSISIPQGVTSIDYGAFAGCAGLTSMSIPQEVTSIGYGAFYDCPSLSNISFNSATTTIFDSVYTISTATKIIGYDPSTAKAYATKYNRQFEVMGPSNTLQSIAITTPAAKLIYTVGDTLDISGLVVTGTYSDGSTGVESITAENITGFNSSAVATNQILTIRVGAKTTTYKVQIVAANHNKYDWQQQRNGFHSTVVASNPSQ